jgi:hypothetical protein
MSARKAAAPERVVSQDRVRDVGRRPFALSIFVANRRSAKVTGDDQVAIATCAWLARKSGHPRASVDSILPMSF